MGRAVLVLSTPAIRSDAKICAYCGKEFFRDPRNSWHYWGRAKYCGQPCAGRARSREAANRRGSIEEKFWGLVEKRDGCWPWKGARDKDGYGVMEYGGKMRRAGIVALEIDGRPISKGQYACHTCDNPPCVRQDHLYPGTPTQNMADAKRRNRVRVGEAVHCAKLTEDQVRIIRQSSGTHDEIAAQYGVSRATITLIRLRKTWRHVW